MGRNDKYETHVKPHLEDIKGWYELFTEEEIAEKLGVNVRTFANYKKRNPELREALIAGKRTLVFDLKNSLKKKAKGFTYEETKTSIRDENGKEVKVIEKFKRYSPPDPVAIHMLLKNLDDTWRNDDKVTYDLKRERMELEKKLASIGENIDDGEIAAILDKIRTG